MAENENKPLETSKACQAPKIKALWQFNLIVSKWLFYMPFKAP